MTVSNRSLIMLADALRQRRTTLGRSGDVYRRRQALLVEAPWVPWRPALRDSDRLLVVPVRSVERVDQGAASGGGGTATPAPLGSPTPASGPCAAGGTACRPCTREVRD